jgi:hypothetical protein
MLGLLTTALNMIGTVAPLFTTSDQVASAIKVVAEAVPVAIAAGQDLWEQVKPAITAIRQSEATTPEQLAELDAIESRGDAAFDAAYAAAAAEDEAAKRGGA